MEFKKTSFKYLLTIAIPIATLCFIYFLQRYTPKKVYTSPPSDEKKYNPKKNIPQKNISRGPPTLTPNPDGCEITGENGECIDPGSF